MIRQAFDQVGRGRPVEEDDMLKIKDFLGFQIW
jgi:hypothetical protein